MVKNIGVFKDFNDDSIKSVFKTENNEIIENLETKLLSWISRFYYIYSTEFTEGLRYRSLLSSNRYAVDEREFLRILLCSFFA